MTHLLNEYFEYFVDLLTKCKTRKLLICGHLVSIGVVSAETEGFEPSVELPLHTLSKRAPSATRTSLHFLPGGKNTVSIFISRIFFQHLQL